MVDSTKTPLKGEGRIKETFVTDVLGNAPLKMVDATTHGGEYVVHRSVKIRGTAVKAAEHVMMVDANVGKPHVEG